MNAATFSQAGMARRSIEFVCKAFACLGFALFLIAAAVSAVSVAGRALLHSPVPGDYELIQMFSSISIAMCLPYCELKRGHVFVDFFTMWASEPLKQWLDVAAGLLLALVAFLIAWRTWHGMLEIREYQEMSMVLGLPIWWSYILLTPSFVLLGLTALMNLGRPVAPAPNTTTLSS